MSPCSSLDEETYQREAVVLFLVGRKLFTKRFVLVYILVRGVGFFAGGNSGGYEVHEWKDAFAALKGDFSKEWNNITEILSSYDYKEVQ